jgi:hypothetical protein
MVQLHGLIQFTCVRALSIILTSSVLTFSQLAHTKAIYPGDIVGRDLNYPLLGYLGHVGIAMGDALASSAPLVIEVLNKKPAIQINRLLDFKQQSKYWGSRYGIGDNADGTRRALAEANHQRWLCPTYTNSTAYTIGKSDPKTGQIITCGVWRCDTLVAWSFFSAGYPELMNYPIMLPRNIFQRFPYVNQETRALAQAPFLPLEKNIDLTQRDITIDNLAMSHEADVIPKFLAMYKTTEHEELKTKLRQGMMIYYQNNKKQLDTMPEVRATLKQFYASAFNTPDTAGMMMRGYIDFHTPDEILTNTDKINHHLEYVEPHTRLGLQHNLAYTSQALEALYIPSTIAMLQAYNRSDLDDMFFGLTTLSHQHLKLPASIQAIKIYMGHVAQKYTQPHISSREHASLSTRANPNDPYFNLAKASFYELSHLL